MQGLAFANVIFGIVLFQQGDKNPYVYVPAMAMVGVPCIQSLRQYKANWLARRWMRNFHRAEREKDMMQLISVVRSQCPGVLHPSWPAPCPTTPR